MAGPEQNVSVKISLTGDHLKQLKDFATSVSKVTTKVKELQDAIAAIGGAGNTSFSSSHLVSALGEVKTAIAAIKDTGLASISKSIEALNDKQVNNFAAAIERLKAGLDPTLVQNITAFGNALQQLNVAQTKFSGAETARQVSALLEGLKNVENINASHIQAIGNALANLNVGANISSIEAISRLGYALRSIKDFGDGKSPLTNLADGMRSLIGLKASDTFLYRVRQITLAASLLSKSEPVDFSKFTQGLQELGKFDVNAVNWENITRLNKSIKEAFEDLRTIKIPNIKGLMQGLSMVNDVYANLKSDQLNHIATTLVREFGVLSKLKMPQLGSLTKNLKVLSSGEYDFNAVATNINTFKKSLMGLHGIQLPNLGAFIGGFKALTGVSFSGMDRKITAFTARVKQLKESATLDGWDKIRTPNLSSFVKGIHDLGAIRLDESHLQNINHNIRSIPKKLREIAAIQVPDMTKFASGLLELSRPAINAQKAASTISKALKALNDNLPKHEVKLPNLSGLTKGIRDFQVLQEAGKINTASITSIATDIKGLVDQLKNIDKVNLPNIQNVASGIHKLSVSVPANAGTIAAGNIEAIVTAVKKLDGVTVPDLTKISKAFKTLNESTLRGMSDLKTKETTTTLQHNLDVLKSSLASLKDAAGAAGKGGGIPNLKNIADAFKVLNDTTLKTEEVFRNGKMGIGSESIFRLRNNLDIIKQAIKELQDLNKDAPKMPNLKGIVDAFKDLNSPLMKLEESFRLGKTGLQSESIYRFHNNMELIKQAIRDLQALGGKEANKIPNLKGVLDSFKILNESTLKGAFTDDYGKQYSNLLNNVAAIKHAITELQSLGGKGANKIPNLKGILDSFKILNESTLKGAFTDDYGKQHSNLLNNLAAIRHVITELQSLGSKEANKIPSLKGITDSFKVLNDSTLKGAFTDDYGKQHSNLLNNLAAIRHVITELQSLGGKSANKIPSLKGITDSFKALNDTTLKTEEVFRNGKMGIGSESIFQFRNNLDIIKQAITELQNLNKDAPKMPNLKGIVDAFKDLNSPLMKLEESFRLGKTGLQSESIYRFHNNMELIKQAIRDLQALGSKDANKIPNLNGILDAFKVLNENSLKGFSTWSTDGSTPRTIQYFHENIAAIRQAISDLQALGGKEANKIPNLTGITNAFKTLNSSFSKGITDDYGNLIKSNLTQNIEAISEAIKKLQKLGGKDAPKIPNLKNIADAFKILDEAIPKGKTAFDIHRFEGRIEQIKTAISNLQSLGGKEANKIPNLKSIADAFTALDAIPKSVRVGWTGRFRLNIDQIIEAIEDLQKLGGKGSPKIPNLKSIGDAFVALDRIPVPKDNKFTTGHFEENINKIEDVIKRLQALGGKDANRIPNLKNIADAFKVLNESGLWGFSTWKQGAASGDFVSHIDKNLSEITRVITALQQLNKAAEGGKSPTMPNLKNIADAFKILNGEVLQRVTEDFSKNKSFNNDGITAIQRNLQALKDAFNKADFSEIKIPNLKNVADAFKILNGEALQHVTEDFSKNKSLSNNGITAIQRNLQALKDAFNKADFSEIKVPNLKNVADAFKTLNSIEKLETVPDGTGTQSRVKHYVDEIAKAFQSANETLKDVKLPNIKNVADAFRILNSIEVKEDKNSNFVQNLKKVWEQLRAFKRDTELQDIKFPNLKNIADGFRTLDTVLKSSDKIETGKFGTNFQAVKGAIEQLKDYDKLKLPNLKNIADAFKILNESFVRYTFDLGSGKFNSNIGHSVDVIKEALEKLKSTEVTKLPNLKNIADAFDILNKIPENTKNTEIGKHFKDNMAVIVSVLTQYSDQLSKVKLPNLKNLADAFTSLNAEEMNKERYEHFMSRVRLLKKAIKELHEAVTTINKDTGKTEGVQVKLPNLEGLAKAFKILNELDLKKAEGLYKAESNTNKGASRLQENVRAIAEALRVFENTKFDLPNINNFAVGLKRLNDIATVNSSLGTNMEHLKSGLEVLRGFQVPQLKNFAEGLHALDSFSKKSKGELISDKLAQDLTDLATSLRQFTGITLPPNLQGFARGIEAIAKVNIQDFTEKFKQLMRAMKDLNFNVPQTAIDALIAKLVVCEHALHAIQNRLNQTASSFSGFGNSTKPAEDGLSRLHDRIKMFFQYRVISALFNKLTTAIQAIPNNIKEFEKSMYNVQSITGATDVTVAKLGTTVKEIASTTKFSAQEVADGMTMIAQAGFTAGQSMQMMQSISNLATGTLSDMKTVVDLVTSAMVVFNIESNDAARVSDVFANAVNKSKLTMDKIKTAFNYIGPVARDANVSFEESAVAMMLLANSGQKASTIGTGLRNVFATLLSPSKKLTEAAAAVGVSLTDLDPRVNSFKDVISNLGIVVRDSQVALDVFGKRGSTAVLSLTNGAKDFDRLYSAVTRVGSAAEMASKQQEGLYVRWKNLTDRAQLLAVTLGQNGITGAISLLVNAISGAINWINGLNESFGGRVLIKTTLLITALGALTAAFTALKIIAVPVLSALYRNFISLVAALSPNFAKLAFYTNSINGAFAATATGAGKAAAATALFGTAVKSLLPIVGIITAISIAISLMVEDIDKVKNRLQDTTQVLDKINNQAQSVTAALDKITKLRPKTEEYANAIKSLMNAITENKGPIAGAEDEFRALQKAINDTNDGFVDGGRALALYLRKLKELAAVQASLAVKDAAKVFESTQPDFNNMDVELRKELGVKPTGAFMTPSKGGYTWGKLSFEQGKTLVDKVQAGATSIEKAGFDKNSWSTFLNGYNTLREHAESFLATQKEAGRINYFTPIKQVEELAIGLGETGKELEAILTLFAELNKVEAGRVLNSVVPSDVQKAAESLADLVKAPTTQQTDMFSDVGKGIESITVDSKELLRVIEKTKDEMANVASSNKTGIVYTDDDVKKAADIAERFLKLQEYTKQYRKYFEDAMAEAYKIKDVEAREQRILEIQREKARVQLELQKKADEIATARNTSENVASLTRGMAVYRQKEEEIAAVESRIANTRVSSLEQSKKLFDRIYEINERIGDIRKGIFYNDEGVLGRAEVKRLEEERASLEKTIRSRRDQQAAELVQLEELKQRKIEEANTAYAATQRLSKPVEVYVKELLKADKEEQKIREVQLQRELNRIHILEDAHKQSEGRIGLSFEQARAKEQEAIARFTAVRLAALAKMEEDVKVKYSLSTAGNEDQRKEYDNQLKAIRQQREKVVEEGYKRQHDLEQKYMKASMAIAKEAGDKIERQAKKANEARTREQEKAMHEIAQLEAKGVITHEEAEKRKAEVSVKYHNELIASYKKQIEDLVKVGAAENIQQIVKLEEEIGKSTHEAIKAARKGLEDQTKALHEAETKLEEIQGSKYGREGYSKLFELRKQLSALQNLPIADTPVGKQNIDKLTADIKTVELSIQEAGDFSKEQQKKITEEYAEEIEKKKKLVKEGFDYEVEYTFSSTSKVAEAIRKHYDKVDSIRSKSVEKQETLEKDMVKKQEDYEKKKLDIRQKYNKKELDLANEKQDILDRLEDSGKGSKKTEKKRVSRAKSRIESAGGQIDAATAAEDKQTLEAIANQLKADVNTLANSSKPKAHRGTIEGAFALRQQILEAQRKIEEKEEERKFQRELEKDKRRLSILKESAEQALIAEDGRHQLAMQHLEQEAEKMREKIRLAQEEVEVYNRAIREGEELLAKRTGIQPQTPQSQQQAQSSGSNEPAPYRVVVDDKGVAHNVPVRKSQALPTNEVGTYQHAVNQAIEGALSVANAAVANYPGLDPAQIEEAKKTLQEMLLSTKRASEEAADSAGEAAASAGEAVEGISEEVATQVKSTFESLNAEVDKFAGYLNTQATNISNAFGSAIEGAVSEDRINLITQKLESSFTNFKGFVDGVFADIVKIPVAMDNEQVKQGVKETKADVDRLVREAYALVVKGNVEDALRKLKEVKTMLDSLQDKVLSVRINQTGQVPEPSTNKADGGLIYRRLQSRFINTGSGNKDDVPALLMKNEFVHRAAAVKKYGVDFMYKLNNLQIPASITKMFASGGLVSNAVGAVHKFANGGLIRSTKRKLEELFAGSGVNLNVDNLNITGKMEEAANQFTSPIGLQAMGMLAKNIESGIAKFVVGGPISNAALTSAQIRNISAAYSSSIAKAQASGNAAIAQAMTEERKRLYDLSDELQAILASLNEEYNTQARKLTDEHKQKLKEKKEEYDKNVEEENTSYNEKVESDTKSYEKEDKDYAKSKSERDTNYQESLQELKDSLEKDRLDYEANLLSKQQAVLEREAAIQNFRNQLNSERYPVGSSQHSSASIEELIYAHAEYAKKKYGSDRMYIIDMGGTISQPNLSDEEKKAELQRLKEAIRPMSRGQKDSLNRAYTKAYNSEPRYFYDYLKQADSLKAFYNKERGYTAYREAAARAEGELEEIPMEQSIPYYTYLMQHLRSDYTLPMQQATLELQSAMTEDTPDTKVTKEINKLTKEYKEATDEAEESRIESLEERKKNIAERETSHKDKLAELKKEYDDFVAEENKTYQESLAKLKEETETKVEDAKAGNYENIEIVKNNTADIIEYAKTKMRRSVAAARSDKERWLNNVQNASREQANKNAADALSTANAYVPEYVSTEPKTGNAMSVAQGLLGGVDIDELLKKLRSGVLKFAKGGLVPLFRGAKAGTDSVLSLLSPHEFVMSAKAVKAFGVNFMNSLNNLKVPAFATGGMVGASTPVSESAIDKIVNKTVYALDLTLNNTHIGELMGEKDTIDSFMTAMNRARMGIA